MAQSGLRNVPLTYVNTNKQHTTEDADNTYQLSFNDCYAMLSQTSKF